MRFQRLSKDKPPRSPIVITTSNCVRLAIIILVSTSNALLSHQVTHHHQQQPKATTTTITSPNNKPVKNADNVDTNLNTSTLDSDGNSESGASIEDLLKETMVMLDNLDHRVNSVKNKTSNALMRDNLRLLDDSLQSEASQNEPTADDSSPSAGNDFARLDEASIEEALVLSDKPTQMNREIDSDAAHIPAESLVTVSGTPSKKARQLFASTMGSHQQLNQNSLASDSTDRHIKFTLDLMQSIFTNQGYSVGNQNSLESFLISPFSIQMVLMLMHLGSRGATKREISQCLHLSGGGQDLDLSLLPPALATSPTNESDLITMQPTANESPIPVSKLKRRQGVGAVGHQVVSKSNNQYLVARSQAAAKQAASVARAEVAHELFGAALKNLLKDQSVGKALSSANKIFLQKNLALSSQYESAIKHYYSTEIKQVDFQQQDYNNNSTFRRISNNSISSISDYQHQPWSPSSSVGNSVPINSNSSSIQALINDWVERQTKGKISNFLMSPVAPSTLMMALNVIFFKGDWQYKFDPADTQSDASFTQANGKTLKVPMMVNRLPLAYAHNPQMKTSVIELPYKAQRLGLFLMLPDETSGIFNTMQMLNSSSFANLIASMRKQQQDQGSNGINVRIPKFSIESSPRLSYILSQQMGLKSLFSPDLADLSAMFQELPALHSQSTVARPPKSSPIPTGPHQSNQTIPDLESSSSSSSNRVCVDELLHKAILQVDENGSVAAASSATIVERVGLFNGNYFEADHPFLLFLMDKQTGLVLFSGVYAGPQSPSSAGSSQDLISSSVSRNHQAEQQIPKSHLNKDT